MARKPRDFDAEQIDIDLEANHRPNKRQVLLPRRFVDGDPGFLDVILELGHHRIGDLEIFRQLAQGR